MANNWDTPSGSGSTTESSSSGQNRIAPQVEPPATQRSSSRPVPASDNYEFRTDLLPLALLTTKRTLVQSDAEPIFAIYRDLCAKQVSFVAISDVRGSTSMPDPLTRKCFAEHAQRFALQSKPWSLGSIVVVKSEVVRGAMTAIQWLSRSSTQHVYCADLHSAVDHAISLLNAAGVHLPSAVSAFRKSLVTG